MKKLQYLLIGLVSLSLFSCDNIQEEIYLNEDGSGEYILYSDMIPSMKKMTKTMMGMFKDSTTTEADLDSTVDAQIWEDFPGTIDSIIDYKSGLPDSILQDEKQMKIINKMVGFMKGGKDVGYVHTGIRYPFDNLTDLSSFQKTVEENQSKTGQNQMMAGLNSGETKVNYEFKKGTFKRNTKWLKQPEMGEKEKGMMLMMLGEAKVTTTIHLPKEAVKVKAKNLISQDGKTVVLEYSLIDYISGKADTDFEIKMK